MNFWFRCRTQKYTLSQFDADTFIVIDKQDKREICVFENYDEVEDAEETAKNIALLLNGTIELTN